MDKTEIQSYVLAAFILKTLPKIIDIDDNRSYMKNSEFIELCKNKLQFYPSSDLLTKSNEILMHDNLKMKVKSFKVNSENLGDVNGDKVQFVGITELFPKIHKCEELKGMEFYGKCHYCKMILKNKNIEFNLQVVLESQEITPKQKKEKEIKYHICGKKIGEIKTSRCKPCDNFNKPKMQVFHICGNKLGEVKLRHCPGCLKFEKINQNPEESKEELINDLCTKHRIEGKATYNACKLCNNIRYKNNKK